MIKTLNTVNIKSIAFRIMLGAFGIIGWVLLIYLIRKTENKKYQLLLIGLIAWMMIAILYIKGAL